MSEEVDRVTADQVALLLDIPVSAVPDDFDALTAGLWISTCGELEPMPESAATRWEMISRILTGLV